MSTRQAARALGRESIARRFPVSEAVAAETRFVDATRAHQIARQHVAAVRQKEAEAAAEGEEDPIGTALAETEYRVETIAATEAAQAATDERIDAAREYAEASGVDVLQEWNAEGDACEECMTMDGETVPIDERFSNGLLPGSAHPRCRCWLEILTNTHERAA